MSEAVTPDNGSQDSFETALAAAMGAMEQVVAPPEPAKAPEPAPAQVAPSASTPPATETPPAPSAKELERVAALEAREAKIRAAEEKAAALEAREAALAKREAATAAQWEKFSADPVGAIRAMRPELSASEAALVAEQLYFHAMGDKAPPEQRTKQEVSQLKTQVRSEVEQLRTELEELRASRARMEQEQQVAAYKAELRAGAEALADAPIVANLAKRNPARAQEMLFEVARRAALESKQQGAAEPVVLTAAQAAAKLEAILKAERDELYGTPAVTTAPNVQQQAPSQTISNRDASIQPGRVAPDPLDDKTLRKAALEAAGLGHIAVWD